MTVDYTQSDINKMERGLCSLEKELNSRPEREEIGVPILRINVLQRETIFRKILYIRCRHGDTYAAVLVCGLYSQSSGAYGGKEDE